MNQNHNKVVVVATVIEVVMTVMAVFNQKKINQENKEKCQDPNTQMQKIMFKEKMLKKRSKIRDK